MLDSNDLTKYQGDRFIGPTDLINLRDEADAERESLVEQIEDTELNSMEQHDAERDLELWDEENGEALKELRELCDEINTDEPLIRDSEIETYLGELVYECGDIPENLPSYVSITIDFDALKQDYSSYEYGSDTYWQRCV